MRALAVGVAGRGLVAPDDAVFTVGDEALLRGAAAFETVRVYHGRPFLLDRHLARLDHSIRVLGLPPAPAAAELALLVAAAAPPEHVLRLFRTDEALVATAAELPAGLDELRSRGLALRTFEQQASALLAGVKSTSYAAAFAARRDAERSGADDALFVSDGRVLDTATANIWWCVDGVLHTPPEGPGVLPGVTRGLVLELEDVVVERAGIDVVAASEEVFTTSSVREVMPVTSIDDRRIGDGRPRPVAARLQAALRLRSTP